MAEWNVRVAGVRYVECWLEIEADTEEEALAVAQELALETENSEIDELGWEEDEEGGVGQIKATNAFFVQEESRD